MQGFRRVFPGAALEIRIGPLTAGTRIGPYEITGWLGAGGMGEDPTARTYAAAGDGQRFLVANATPQARSEPIRVVLNWQAALRH